MDANKKITAKEYGILYDLSALLPLAAKASTKEFPDLPEKIEKCREIVNYFNKHPERLQEFVSVSPQLQERETPKPRR